METRLKKIKVREEEEKLRKTLCFLSFSIVLGPGGSKSGLANAAGAELSSQTRDQKIARGCGAKQISM
jgi:hypothetical protein